MAVRGVDSRARSPSQQRQSGAMAMGRRNGAHWAGASHVGPQLEFRVCDGQSDNFLSALLPHQVEGSDGTDDCIFRGAPLHLEINLRRRRLRKET